MDNLKTLFDNNRRWAEGMTRRDPAFFERLAHVQTPKYLWIGCADSRVPANEIIGLLPGEIFVHRNVANLVIHTDLNCLSVIQYAVDVLKVEHIIVCGHDGCGGVRAVLDEARMGLIDNWLRHLGDLRDKHAAALRRLKGQAAVTKLCELNVAEQALNVCATTMVQEAWRAGRKLSVHGWFYSLRDGRLRDRDICLTGPASVAALKKRL